MLTFHANPQHLIAALGEETARRILGEKVGENLTDNQGLILELLRQYPYMAARELAQHVGISSRKIEQNIAKLKGLGILKRVGPAKGGQWKVLK